MKLERWALLAEVVSGVAILATLIFLVVETRANTAELRRQSALDRARFVTSDMANSPDLADLLARIQEQDGHPPWITAFMDTYDFTAEESIRFTRHLEGIWFAIQADYLAGVEGLADGVRGTCDYPDTQLFLENYKDELDSGFVEWYAELCRE